jgi:hypothetical protein
MASLTLLDGRDLPEVLRKRGQLYLGTFCVLALFFLATATRPQSDGVLNEFRPLLGLLTVTTGALALLLLRRSRIRQYPTLVAPGKWARTQHFRRRRAVEAYLPRRNLAQLALKPTILLASVVERRLIPATLRVLSSSLSALYSRARRRLLDSRPAEDADETLESLASWRSMHLKRLPAVDVDLPKLSPPGGEAIKDPPKAARPDPRPVAKHDPWSKVLADFEAESERRPRSRR